PAVVNAVAASPPPAVVNAVAAARPVAAVDARGPRRRAAVRARLVAAAGSGARTPPWPGPARGGRHRPPRRFAPGAAAAPHGLNGGTGSCRAPAVPRSRG